MDEDRIVLDRKSFEALAVDSRVKILKSLKQRRKTLSELAEEQKMSVSGVKEHLETLEKVGLIEKKDDGHKWKYYELTKKGSEIIGPKEIRVWILLAISMIAFIASFLLLPSYNEVQDSETVPNDSINDLKTSFDITEDATEEAVDYSCALAATTENTSKDSALITSPESELPVTTIVAAISLITTIACIIILVKNRAKSSAG
jgi:DNA-binding transcriptional ArsR family regulator